MISVHASPLASLRGADVGGQNVHVSGLAVALARRGHRVTVHTRRDDVTLPDSVPYAPGVTVSHVRAGPARPLAANELPPYMEEFAGRLARLWSSQRPDIVHAHFWLSGLAALHGVRGLGVPVVQTFHSLCGARRETPRDSDTPERPRLEAQVALGASATIATCTDEAGELGAYGMPSDAVHVVPGGIDVSRFRPGGPVVERGDRPRVLTVGSLVPHQGVATVIEALCHVPEAELVIAGGPGQAELERDPEMLRLRRLAVDRGVAKRVGFAGRVRHEDLPALIRSADVVVSVPWSASFGMATLEAMACGMPVAVSAVGGHLDTVVDGVTGLHVPPRVPSALAGRLRRLFSDPRLGQVLGLAAARRVRERYGWSRVAGETEAIYGRVVDGGADLLLAADGARS